MAVETDQRRGGGWNRKTLDEHLQDGTYRRDRHGPIVPEMLQWRKKPAGIIRASATSQSRWVRSAADEYALKSGCRFNEALAEYTAEFFPTFLCHSKGEWANQPFELTDWQRDELIYPLFGWVREDGTRRFRRTYIEVPKKNYKSTTAAGIGLYMLAGDEEAGAEVYSLGADRDQARVVHNEAINMVEASPALAAVLKINRTTGTISYRAIQAWYRALSAAPRGKHGINASCAVADELHEWYGTELWESIRYAFRARRQPLLFVITNAGNDMESVCYRQREKAMAVLSGAIQDDSFLAIVCAAMEEDAIGEIEAVKAGSKDLPVAASCNPGLGHIIKTEDLVQDIRDAAQTPSEIPNLLRLTYGVWRVSESPFLRVDKWAACAEDYTEADLYGQECYGGLDLSTSDDMTALGLVFPDVERPGEYRQLAYFWLPEPTIAARAHLVNYQQWVDAGYISAMHNTEVTEFPVLEEELAEILARFQIKELCYDRIFATETTQRLAVKFPYIVFIEFPQNMMRFAGPTAEYERLVVSGKIKHNRNPVLTWQAGHVQVLTDRNNNKRPIKPKPKDHRKVDGIVAEVMAVSRAMLVKPDGSVYETGDLKIA